MYLQITQITVALPRLSLEPLLCCWSFWHWHGHGPIATPLRPCLVNLEKHPHGTGPSEVPNCLTARDLQTQTGNNRPQSLSQSLTARCKVPCAMPNHQQTCLPRQWQSLGILTQQGRRSRGCLAISPRSPTMMAFGDILLPDPDGCRRVTRIRAVEQHPQASS